MANPWFRQKQYGYGATPINWKGWAFTGAYGVVVGALCAFLFSTIDAGAPRPLLFLGLVTLVTGPFLYVCWRKTEGGWRWRWGE